MAGSTAAVVDTLEGPAFAVCCSAACGTGVADVVVADTATAGGLVSCVAAVVINDSTVADAVFVVSDSAVIVIIVPDVVTATDITFIDGDAAYCRIQVESLASRVD